MDVGHDDDLRKRVRAALLWAYKEGWNSAWRCLRDAGPTLDDIISSKLDETLLELKKKEVPGEVDNIC